MTLKARIAHDMPGYPKALSVQKVDPTTLAALGVPVIVTDGGDMAEYVHGGVALLVTEVDAPVGGTGTDGAGGPGEER